MKRKLTFLSLLLAFCCAGIPATGQPVITYPSSAQSLTRGLDTSLLVVDVGFGSACTSVNVEVRLSAGVSYVPGSVLATGGTGGLTITGNGGTVNAPKFLISNAASGNNITFTLKRVANCGTGASGKDSVFVTSSCGNVSEAGAAINTYNIFAPSLSLTPPSAITNANIGGSYNRTFSVTNGGNGCLDTLRLAIKRPGNSISSPVIKVGANTITASSTSSDTSFYKVYGANLPGGDNKMCNGETVTFTESFTLANCTNLTTTYIANWGRPDNSCQNINATGIINMATGVPNLTAFFSTAAFDNCGVVPHTFNITITNNGTTPASNLNITFGNGGNEFISSFSHFIDTASVMVTAPSLTAYHPTAINVAGRVNIAYANNGVPLCAGGKIGMVDFNMPAGYTLGAGQSMTVTYNMQTCAGGGCDDNTDAGGITTAVTYKDQCGSNSYLMPFGTTTMATGPVVKINTTSAQFPAQVASGACFNYKVDMQLVKSSPPLTPNGYIEYAVTLPAGFTLNTATETGSGLTAHAGYPRMVGNVAYFRHSIIHQASGQSTHTVTFNLCVASGTCGVFPISATVSVSRDSTCTAPVVSKRCISGSVEAYCGVSCVTGGVVPVKWNHYRSTYGLPDNDNDGIPDVSGTIDFNKIDRDRYRPGDILHSEYRSYILNQTSPSVINNWNYVYGEWGFSGGKFAPSGTATVTIKRGAATYVLTGVSITTVTSGLAFKADWSAHSGLPGGFTYQSGDSVIVEADFRVDGSYTSSGTNTFAWGPTGYTADAPGIIQLTQMVYASQTANPPAGSGSGPDRFTCFTPKYNANVVGIHHFISYDGINPNGPVGCANFDIAANAYSRILSSYANGRYFTYEYRPEALPDTVTLDIPAGWDYIGVVETDLYFTNAPSSSTALLLNITPVASSYLGGTRLTYDFKTLLQNGTIPHWGTDGMQFRMVNRLRANCNTPATANVMVTERGHWNDYPSAATPNTYILTNSRVLNYNLSSRPSIAVQNNTGVVQGVLPQHFWDVQVNSTGSTTASYVWVALEQGTSGISIDSVVLKPSNTVLTANTYSGTKKWYQVSTAGIASGSNQQARVYFKYSSCNTDSIKMLTGWSCSGYPSPDPTGNACSEIATYLKVQPQASQVQLSLSKQPVSPGISMCTQDSVTAIINSALGANVDHPVVTIIPPVGLTVNLPVQVEYPLGSGIWQNVTATNVSGNYAIDMEQHTGIGANGLPGTINNPAAAGRQAKIRIVYSSTCDFVSGSRIGFITNGQTPCGTQATGDGSYVSSDPINITGATTTGTAGLMIDVSPPELTCGSVKMVPFSITPLSAATQNGDLAVYTLPAGIEYSGSFGPGNNCTGCTLTQSTGTGNSTVLTVALPAGIGAGNTLAFTMGLKASKVTACGNSTITGEAQRSISGLTCGVSACPVSKIVIGSTSQMVTIKKPVLNITSINFTQSSVATVNYSLVINNNGTEAAGAGYLVKIYCGTDASGKVLHSFTTNSIAIGGSDTYTGSFTRSAASCAAGSMIFAKVEDTTVSGSASCMCASSLGASSMQVLPVKFTYNKAQADGCNAKLEWGYEATNTTVDRFVIERSEDGRSFTAVAELMGNANNYTDNLPSGGNWYYRIRVKGKDNSTTYSTTMSINAGKCSNSIISVFPNPATDEVQVRLAGGEGTATYVLNDMTGRTLQQGVLTAHSNNRIDVKNLANGFYTIRVILNGSVYTHNIRIVK